MKIRRPFWKSADAELSCREVGRVLQWYLDGELDEADVPALRAHLDRCKDCGLEAETYEAISESLSQRRPQVDADVLDRLRTFGRELVEADGTPET